MKKHREEWKEQQAKLPGEQLVFIDESSAKTNLTRLRGRCPRGRRLHDHAPCGNWHTTSMISSIRSNGQTAAFVIEGAIDGLSLVEYVKRILVPTLSEGDIVIWDNLSVHRNLEARRLIEATGAEVLFLPAYSPDLNPIEKMWSKVKAILRKAKARSFDDLVAAVGQALEAVTQEDAKSWFASCGYSLN